MRRVVLAALSLLALVLNARSVRGERPTFELHGFGEVQLRTYAKDYHPGYYVFSQWANVLNLEGEADLLPAGFGPIDLLSVFSRVEVRYDCVYTGCGVVPSWRYFGDRANSAPRNLTTAVTNPFSGTQDVKDSTRLHSGNELEDFFVVPPFDALRELGAEGLEETFAPIDDALFAFKKIDASLGTQIFSMGPWRLDTNIDAVGSLETIPSPTLGLPLRPPVPPPGKGGRQAHGLFVPSQAFLERWDDFGNFEQNLSEKDVSWNHTQSQDERELKELYADIEMFEGRLWLRAGKQNIVWGKTELFRTTDQFNPQHLALSSLPTLEESRIPLWSVRGTWSFYDVGPLEDVRLELAANLDDFEPLDLGRCGMTYAIWLVCAKTFGLWANGFAGAGVAGEERPPDPFESTSWVEVGGRVEFRYGRFSFQISDFYGYEDAPVADFFAEYGRRVDPLTGRPLDVNGDPLVPGEPADQVLRLHPGNRQLFDVVCSSTLGIAGSLIPSLADRCLVDLLNSDADVGVLGLTPPEALGTVLGGSTVGETVAGALAAGTIPGVPVDLVELNKDPNDGPGGGFFSLVAVGAYLTTQQQGLLGCGEWYGTSCDVHTDTPEGPIFGGVDLFNAEASVLLQAFPQFEVGGAVATRPVDGLPAILPGTRGPQDDINRNGIPDVMDPSVPVELDYDPLVDGCVAPSPGPCAGAHALIDPRTGGLFCSCSWRSESGRPTPTRASAATPTARSRNRSSAPS
jgi:hypothetical protein